MLVQQPRTLFTTIDRFQKVIEDVNKMGLDTKKNKVSLGSSRSQGNEQIDMGYEGGAL